MHFDLRADAIKGQVKAAMIAILPDSNERDVTITRKPLLKVRTQAAFEKGCFQLIAISPSVGVAIDKNGKPNAPASALPLSSPLFEHKGERVRPFIKPSLIFPKELPKTGCAQSTVQPFVAAYWAARHTLDPEEANCIRSSKQVEVCVGPSGEKHVVEIPTMINKKAMDKGDEVILYKKGAAEVDNVMEPPAKKAKIEPAKGKAKGKAQGKAKSKAQAKA